MSDLKERHEMLPMAVANEPVKEFQTQPLKTSIKVGENEVIKTEPINGSQQTKAEKLGQIIGVEPRGDYDTPNIKKAAETGVFDVTAGGSMDYSKVALIGGGLCLVAFIVWKFVLKK